MNKVNQKRAIRLIGSTVKTLNFTSNMIGLRAAINPMNYRFVSGKAYCL